VWWSGRRRCTLGRDRRNCWKVCRISGFSERLLLSTPLRNYCPVASFPDIIAHSQTYLSMIATQSNDTFEIASCYDFHVCDQGSVTCFSASMAREPKRITFVVLWLQSNSCQSPVSMGFCATTSPLITGYINVCVSRVAMEVSDISEMCSKILNCIQSLTLPECIYRHI
jgi:hypothetical protein